MKAKFVGIDDYNRPVFYCKENKQYYCLVDLLLRTGETPTQEQIDDAVALEGVHIKGSKFFHEPERRVLCVTLVV